MALDKNDTVFCSVPLIHVPFLDLLEPVQRAGFSAISMTPTHLAGLEKQGISSAELRQRMADLGLRVAEFEGIAHWLPGQAELAGRVAGYGVQILNMTADHVLPMAAAVGAKSVAVVELFGNPVDMDAAAEEFAAICDKAREYGLIVNIEFLPAGGIGDIAKAGNIVRLAGRANGGITLDTLHFFRGGSTFEDLLALPADMIGMVQLADGPAAAPPGVAQEMVTARLLPGEGQLDIRGIVRALGDMGVKAPVGVEVFSKSTLDTPPDRTANSWMNALKSVTGRA